MIKKVFPILALSTFSSLLGAGIIVPLLPIYAESLGASGIWLGSIAAGFFASNVIVTPIFGRLSDHRGRKVFISIGLFFYAAASFGFLWASTVPQLVLVRFLQGIAGGMILPIAQAYIGDIAPAGEEGKWMGYFNAAMFTGFGVGPLMGGTLTEHFGMPTAFLTMGFLNLLAFLAVAIFLPEVSERKSTSGTSPSFRKMGQSNMIKGLFTFRLSFALGRGAFATFLPIFAGIYLGLSPSLIGVLLAVNLLLMSLLQVYSGNIADRFNRKALIVNGSLINLVYLALIPLATNFWQLLAICILGGLGGAISLPAASALTVEEGRKFGMGSTIAVFTIAFGLGMTTGPLLAGMMADFIGINSVFYFAAAAGLTGTGLFIWFTR
jgi:MFS family permease